MEDWQRYVISPQAALAGWLSVQLDDASIAHIRHGREIEIPESLLSPPGTMGDTVFAYTQDGTLLAILEQSENRLHPRKVFLPGD